MTKKSFLLSDDFSCLVWLKTKRNTFLRREYHIFGEPCWVASEKFSFCWSPEVIKDVFEE